MSEQPTQPGQPDGIDLQPFLVSRHNLPPELERTFGATIRELEADRQHRLNPPVPDPGAGRRPAPEPDDPAPQWDPSQLTGDQLQRGHPYTMPGGGLAFVFPTTGTELALAARWTASLPARMPQAEINIHALAIQVLCCLRRDEQGTRYWPVSEPAFDHGQARLQVLAGLSPEVIREIVTISARLGRGGLYLPPQLLTFLRQTRSRLESWCSASSIFASCPPAWQEQARELLSDCSSLMLRGGSPDE